MTKRKSKRSKTDGMNSSNNMDTSGETLNESNIINYDQMEAALSNSLAEKLTKSLTAGLSQVFRQEMDNFRREVQKSILEVQESQKFINEEFEKNP